jgi:4-amino-4-deoxy-L-arabinose transferase-like glycosyltransferase
LNHPKKARAADRWRWGIPLVALATLLRLGWVLAVPTVPVGDFATYRESANYLLEFGQLDHGFIYMPGFVVLLAGVAALGGELLAQKLLGVLFGGLAAAAIFVITARLCDDDDDHPPEAPDAGARPRPCPCPTAVIATLAYAVWPAGIALASVVGTDVPAASLMVCALACLVRRGDGRRSWPAALTFGAVMGLAAYVRAVALPLTVLSAGYWLARLGWRRWRQVVGLTALGAAATLIVLLPWGLRNRREHGTLSFTDDHGGITALIGANPNSEGTYTRALNVMFQDLTGRSVLAEPHHETDRLAYDLAKDWTRFEPRYALGLVALKAERLFSPEWNLLYWPIGRPGVLVGRPQVWFAARAPALDRLADGFWYTLVALFAAGLALALYDRRWPLLALLPFQLALAATYTCFFAEPRYRIPIEMMAFPLSAFTLWRLWTLAGAIARDPGRAGALTPAARRLAVATAAALVCFLASSALADAGAGLRARHRWAATVWTVDGKARLAKWRRLGPAVGASPVAGAPNGVRLTLPPGAPAVAQAAVESAPLPAGRYELRAAVEPSGTSTARELTLTLTADGAGDAAAAAVTLDGPSAIRLSLAHAGGPLRLVARLDAPARAAERPAPIARSVWLSTFDLRRLPESSSPKPSFPR